RVQGLAEGQGRLIERRTLADGGQTPAEIADELKRFCDAATQSLDIAIYDVRLHGAVADCVTGAIVGAAERGVAVRLVYNVDHPGHGKGPPPPETEPELV